MPTFGTMYVPVMLAVGLLTWTLVEYFIHRFVLHGINPFYDWHQQHHRNPGAPLHIPLVFSLALGLVFIGLPELLGPRFPIAIPFSVGLIFGHISQEVTHHQLHKRKPVTGTWLRNRWAGHNFHHHADNRSHYGTLTGFWDALLRTCANS